MIRVRGASVACPPWFGQGKIFAFLPRPAFLFDRKPLAQQRVGLQQVAPRCVATATIAPLLPETTSKKQE